MSGAEQYDERLGVPLRWWVQGTMLIATFWMAMVVAMPFTWACGFTALLLGLLAAWFLGYGAARITVADGSLRAGRARIEGRHLGGAEALDPEATRRVAGVEADARAYLLLRPYLKRAVRVQLTDPADPTPYWLLSTRHPDRLAAAVTELVGASRQG
ncbi:DUF3093 domain-containing protein [Nocardioides ferulae]|uniref:DUF3093 domain-containing protein n=1 Tax=Nocardioides ferulae TaxID=2340821 RepID=UPI000EADD8F9|nr:DUF3093 domain-containing protein [Nocardioides ferulae]